MYVSEKEKLFQYLGDFEERHAYIDSTIRQLLAMKIRALREARNYDQETLGTLAGGMKQPSISRLEDPAYAKMTLKTLKRLGRAFDVALLVDFVPFSELVDRTTGRTEADYAPPSYDEEHQMSFADVSDSPGWVDIADYVRVHDLMNIEPWVLGGAAWTAETVIASLPSDFDGSMSQVVKPAGVKSPSGVRHFALAA